MTLDDLPKTLYPTRTSVMMLFLASAAFVAGGIWMGTSGKAAGYFCAAFFSLGLVVATVQMIPGSAYLKLTREGFEFSSMFRRHFISWDEVSEFGVATMKQTGVTVHRMVGFNYSEPAKRLSGRALSRSLAGFEGGLPDCYGHKAEDLAGIMSRLHTEYLITANAEQGACGEPVARPRSKGHS